MNPLQIQIGRLAEQFENTGAQGLARGQSNQSLSVLRWQGTAQVSAQAAIEGIERMVNDWLDSHPDRMVTGVNSVFRFTNIEGHRSRIVPCFLVTVFSRKIASGRPPYQAGDRVFRMHRLLIPPSEDFNYRAEDKVVERHLNAYIKEIRGKRITHLTYQLDLGNFMATNRNSVRVLVGTIAEKTCPGETLSSEEAGGQFHVLRWHGRLLTPSQEDDSMRNMLDNWYATHSDRQVVTHTSVYAYVPIGSQRTLTARNVFLLYTEKNGVPRHIEALPGRRPEPQSGMEIIRGTMPWRFSGDQEDKAIAQMLNTWIQANPDKRIRSMTMEYFWGPVYVMGFNAARYMVTINWARDVHVESGGTRPASLRAHAFRRIGRYPDATWTPAEDDRAFEDRVRFLEEENPNREIVFAGVNYGFGEMYGRGRNATRYVALALIQEREEGKVAGLPAKGGLDQPVVEKGGHNLRLRGEAYIIIDNASHGDAWQRLGLKRGAVDEDGLAGQFRMLDEVLTRASKEFPQIRDEAKKAQLEIFRAYLTALHELQQRGNG